MTRRRSATCQAWIELLNDDPEAVSALSVARLRLDAARRLRRLRRLRLLELRGSLPSRSDQEDLLHRSIQFYNPHKERCTIRNTSRDPVPMLEDERVVLVAERDGERRAGAERWWLHETGKEIEVHEGVAWVLSFDGEARVDECVRDLVTLSGRRCGLLHNPHSQRALIASGRVPIPWLSETNGESGEVP
jgi:hypothetical protein